MVNSSEVVAGTSIASYNLNARCVVLTVRRRAPARLRTPKPFHDPHSTPKGASELILPRECVQYIRGGDDGSEVVGSSEVVAGTSIASYDLNARIVVLTVRRRAPAPPHHSMNPSTRPPKVIHRLKSVSKVRGGGQL